MKYLFLSIAFIIAIAACNKKDSGNDYTMATLESNSLVEMNCGDSVYKYLVINKERFVPVNLPDALKYKNLSKGETIYIQYYIAADSQKCFNDFGNPTAIRKAVVTKVKSS